MDHPPTRAAGLLTFGFVVALSAVASGTIAERLSLDELAAHADAVIRAEVTDIDCRWDDEHRGIWTVATLRLDEVIHGAGIDAGDTLTVWARGGQVGTLAQHVGGAARYQIGEAVVAFLWRDGGGRWQTLGMTQGRFVRQTGEAEGDDARYRNSYAGLCIADAQGRVRRDTDAREPQEFTLRQIRDALADAHPTDRGSGEEE